MRMPPIRAAERVRILKWLKQKSETVGGSLDEPVCAEYCLSPRVA
jgi:hypothetical protein